MLRTLAICAGAWFIAFAALAQEPADIPAPERMDPQGIQAWYESYIRADGWTVIGANDVFVAMGSPGGASVMDDGTMLATIRHEYYEPRTLGGHTMRSLQQIRLIDCRRRVNRILSMTIFERSNLQGTRVTRESPNREGTTPTPNSLYLTTIDRVCDAPQEGQRPN